MKRGGYPLNTSRYLPQVVLHLIKVCVLISFTICSDYALDKIYKYIVGGNEECSEFIHQVCGGYILNTLGAQTSTSTSILTSTSTSTSTSIQTSRLHLNHDLNVQKAPTNILVGIQSRRSMLSTRNRNRLGIRVFTGRM
jgi:hypothetical protein